ncbi:conserved Plasmodium protein, unknown function [Plasmodium knowlesi strain H]|uniref:Uncharacterized protein n=3 Tax=Plasmodium knowlesi TaxID=5850 RepID=A0A5K1U5R4_PLAKH|nr:conserved Plasmodium protein, unknown function [Plasmodium knowlesi strain H]OTN64375.1 Uncharacterized protein PKNOH_S130190900 [Plasmodium knowlesi]CAA9989072.1 conserved Plasmodium protein, unknown function [Plasmodium knowlesi strain H]SBO27284.1 conserved Plasmodium protein, unknown function [Plasmodium knowlesi strain H]SBO28912.1 conserved Plasmodium protein, unknown function [Plasmodium knowlesi strain H]VVS78546.1 conserved Plasmodium protein, unknown function [Plasmodium knowlesi |eukprot:XP_002261421.1 hypothetical protein, conserved in Plasmodium species [Plasmodium knowlesi strain H]
MTIVTILSILLILNLFEVSSVGGSYTENKQNEEQCRYISIFRKPLCYRCYIFKPKNGSGIRCCQYYLQKRKEEKLEKLYSLQDIMKNTLNEKDMDDIQNLFPLFNEKLLKINNNYKSGGLNKGNRSITDIDDLEIEFNNKYFNLKDIKVNILNGSSSNEEKNKTEDENYYNIIKEESNFLKKKDELLQNSPFYNGKCFKSIHGSNCGRKKHREKGEENADVDEELDYDLAESIGEAEYYARMKKLNDAHQGGHGEASSADGNKHAKGKNDHDYYDNEYYDSKYGTNYYSENSTSPSSSFFSLSKKFYLLDRLSKNPRKVLQKYIEFKEHLSGSDKKLDDFLDNEYYNTTETINTVLTDDIQKTVQYDEKGDQSNNNSGRGFFSSLFQDFISLFYFPQKNVEL